MECRLPQWFGDLAPVASRQLQGGLRVVTEWATKRRRNEKRVSPPAPALVPAASHVT